MTFNYLIDFQVEIFLNGYIHIIRTQEPRNGFKFGGHYSSVRQLRSNTGFVSATVFPGSYLSFNKYKAIVITFSIWRSSTL